MRYPSIKTLSAVFEDPKRAREILTLQTVAPKGAREVPGVMEYVNGCYNTPKPYVVKLEALTRIEQGLHGVEAVETTGGEFAEYLNAGDTYAPTLIRWRGNYRVQSLGDFIETIERQGVKFK